MNCGLVKSQITIRKLLHVKHHVITVNRIGYILCKIEVLIGVCVYLCVDKEVKKRGDSNKEKGEKWYRKDGKFSLYYFRTMLPAGKPNE